MKNFEGMIFDSDIKNDRIDLGGKIDINIKEAMQDDDEDDTFRFNFKGMSVDYSVINALRRTVMSNVLVYGFNRKNIFIENEKCIYMYNNDLIYNQIETLPVYDVPNSYDLEDLEELPNTQDKNKKLRNIEIFLNVKNDSDDHRYITTHDIVIKIDDKVSDGYKKHDPLSIIVLKPQEEVHLRAVANLSDSLNHAAYEACTFAYHIEVNQMEYVLIYDTLGQISKYDIFTKSCNILIKKLDALLNYVNELENETENKTNIGEYDLVGENDTLGCLLATILQKCEHTAIAGYFSPHEFVDQVIIRFRLNEKTKLMPSQVFIAVIKHAKSIYEHILKTFQKAIKS